MAAAPGSWVLAAGDVTGAVEPTGPGLPGAGGAPPCPGPIFPATETPAPTEGSTAGAATAISQPRRAGPRCPGAAPRLSPGGPGDATGRSEPAYGAAAGRPQGR